jgi:predicted phosphoribosyltransferase/pimeloyl-ACP methyl ester carboxylesterase
VATLSRELEISIDGIDLAGTLMVPDGARALVVFVHGSGSSRHSPRNRLVAAGLRSRSLATLLFDLLTEDEGRADATDTTLRFDIDLLADRLVSVTDWIVRERIASGLPIVYFGASTGAAAALVAAARRPGIIAAIVSRGGRPDLAGQALEAVSAPTLFIVGSTDVQVLALNRAAIERMTAETSLSIVDGAGHLFEEPGALAAVARIAGDWIAKRVPHRPRTVVTADGTHQIANRVTAGRELGRLLVRHVSPDTIVLALPRGGVPVAAEIADALEAPLDVWIARKLGAPDRPELGMGAIAEGPAVFIDREMVSWLGVSDAQLDAIVERETAESKRRARHYRGDRGTPDVRGKTAILVDDGIATGGTIRAAARGLRRAGASRIVIAVPVASSHAIEVLRGEVDDITCLLRRSDLGSVGQWYEDFREVTDGEVVRLLERSDAARGTHMTGSP